MPRPIFRPNQVRERGNVSNALYRLQWQRTQSPPSWQPGSTLSGQADTATFRAGDREHLALDVGTGLWVHIPMDDVTFCGSGAVVTATSLRWYSRDGARSMSTSSNGLVTTSNPYITGIFAALDTAGTSNTTLQLLLNGSPISGSSVTLGSGVHTVGPTQINPTGAPPGVLFSGTYNDYLQVQVTAAGTGAANLTVHVQRGGYGG